MVVSFQPHDARAATGVVTTPVASRAGMKEVDMTKTDLTTSYAASGRGGGWTGQDEPVELPGVSVFRVEGG